MIAAYDTESDLVVIELGDLGSAVDSVDPHSRAIVAVDEHGTPVQIEIAAIALGVEEPLRAVAAHSFTGSNPPDIDLLLAAAGAALAVPDQVVNISIGQRAA